MTAGDRSAAAAAIGLLATLAGLLAWRALGPLQAGDLRAVALHHLERGEASAAARLVSGLVAGSGYDPRAEEIAVRAAERLALSGTASDLGLAMDLIEPFGRQPGRRARGAAPPPPGLERARRAAGRALSERAATLASRPLARRAVRLGAGPVPLPAAAAGRVPAVASAAFPAAGSEPAPEAVPNPSPTAAATRSPRPPVAVEVAVLPTPFPVPGVDPHARAGRPPLGPEAPDRPKAATTPVPPAGRVAPPAFAAVCAAARARDHARAVARIEELPAQALDSPEGDALAAAVYFNASLAEVRARRCDAGRELARRGAVHDDPWRVPSNLSWLRTLEQVRDCDDFNLSTVLQLVHPKPLPGEACDLADTR